jgi:F0F1-type ATP synthase assembly protein I
VDNSQNNRPPLVVAMEWASRLMSIGLEMALPGLGGYWLDQWLGTKVVFLILGASIGFAAGMWQLIQLTKTKKPGQDE